MNNINNVQTFDILKKLNTTIDNIEIKDNIKQQKLIYVAIGSANNFEQQYPSFINTVLNKYNINMNELNEMNDCNNKIDIHIYLIDPEMESQPRVVKQLFKNANKTILCNKFTKYNYGIFNIYSFEYPVSYPGGEINTNTYFKNIISLLTFFNNLTNSAIKNDWFVVVQDYTGRDINKLSLHYDKFIKQPEHLCHIIYGLGSRINSGCFVKLSKPLYDFVLSKDDKIKVFNPYYHDYNIDYKLKDCKMKDFITNTTYKNNVYKILLHEMINISNQKRCNNLKNQEIITQQINAFIQQKYNVIKNNLTTSIRQIKLYLTNQTNTNVSIKFDCSYLNKYISVQIKDLLNMNKFYDAYEQLKLLLLYEIIKYNLYTTIQLKTENMNNIDSINYINKIIQTIDNEICSVYNWSDKIKILLNNFNNGNIIMLDNNQ